MNERALLDLMRRAPDAQKLDELMEHNDGSPRRLCPECGTIMDLVWIDFLQLDRCLSHGVWLDPGELDRVMSSGKPLDLSRFPVKTSKLK